MERRDIPDNPSVNVRLGLARLTRSCRLGRSGENTPDEEMIGEIRIYYFNF